MPTNFPFTSVDYYTEHFGTSGLRITEEELTITESKRFRDEIEFIIIESGSGQLEINNSVISVLKNLLIQLMPYHVHRFILEPNEQIKFIRIRASLGLLLLTATDKRRYQEALTALDKTWPLVLLDKSDSENLIHFCGTVMKEKNNLINNCQALNISLISYVSYTFQKGLDHQQFLLLNNHHTIGWQCLQFIHFHHQEPITLTTVAKNLGLTEKEVGLSVKNLTGQSFNKSLNQVRIRNATALLQFEGLSINQIGRICGYRTDANFYKQFKLIHNQTPSEFQNESHIEKSPLSTDAWDIAIFMLENCRQPLLLEEISQQLNLSEKKINVLLEETFELTFKQLLNTFRTKIAKILMHSLNLSVKDTAELVGFSGEKTLLRNYRKFVYNK